MYGKYNIHHDVRCTNGTSGVMICDVYTDGKPNGSILHDAIDKARTAWQAKLASITPYTKDFDKVSKKIFGGVPCNVRYTYRTNMG